MKINDLKMTVQNYGILLFLFIFSNFYSQNTIQHNINLLTDNPLLENANVTFLAIDLNSGDTIASHNPFKSQAFASNNKLFSTASALEIIGPKYKPKTRIYMAGHIGKDSTLFGDLWIRGGCDVSLGSVKYNGYKNALDFLDDWVALIKEKGINKITGSIYTDGSDFGYDGAPNGWTWSDLGNYYGAASSGVCFHDNMMELYFETGKAGTKSKLIKTLPEFPDLIFHNYISAAKISYDGAYIYGGPYSSIKYGKGILPENKEAFMVKSSMPDPSYQLSYELNKKLIEYKLMNSIKVTKENSIKRPIYNDSTLLFSYEGKTIGQIIKETNTYSVNFFAEGLVQLIGYIESGNGTTSRGLKDMKKYWSDKFTTKGLYITDGSGLSRSNALNASHFCSLLKYMYSESDHYDDFFNSLAVAGKTGTFKNLCSDQLGEGRVFGKSGTLTRVKAYSGYVHSNSGKKIAFSFSINNFNCSKHKLVKLFSKTLNAMAVY